MNPRPGDKLLRYCVGKQNLFIVAPYIKANALHRVLDAASTIESLVCVTRWHPHDLATGVSDVECRTIVRERGGAFLIHPSLHAKYYRMNDVALVGSANLTYSGMGWAIQPNLEILIKASNDFDLKAFQQELLKAAREITEEEFLIWEAVSKSHIEESVLTDVGQTRLHTWRPNTRDLRNLELAYLSQDEKIASFDELRTAWRDIQAMQIPPGLNSEQIRSWSLTCLLAAPFTNTVIGLHDAEVQVAARTLAQAHGLGITEARRDMETVQNWLEYLRPHTLSK